MQDIMVFGDKPAWLQNKERYEKTGEGKICTKLADFLHSECIPGKNYRHYRKVYHSLGYHTWQEMDGKDVHHTCGRGDMNCINKNHLTLLSKDDHFISVHNRGKLDRTGKSPSKPARLAISKKLTGRKQSKEQSERKAELWRGENNPNANGDNVRGEKNGNYGQGHKWQGEKGQNAKLTNAQALAIREEYASGKTSYRQLAQKYNVSSATIGYIVTNKTFKNV